MSWPLPGLSRENSPLDIHRYKKMFIIGVDSHSYVGQEVPWSTIWKLEDQESKSVLSPKDWASWDPGLNLKALCAKAGKYLCLRINRESEFALSLHFFHLAFKRWDNAHLYWWGQSSLLSRPNRILINLFQIIFSRDTLTDKPRNNILPTIWTSLSPVKLICERNHRKLQGKSGWS